jgi:saccharopine dehydrogenase (NADP+, L-glutamate forming)/spermidine synthase
MFIMTHVLVLGGGRVSGPTVHCLLQQPGVTVTVADCIEGQAEQIVAGRPNARAVVWSSEDRAALDRMIADATVVISLLPPPLHPAIGQACVAAGKPLVTTSYVSPEMRSLDAAARSAGVVLLNEMGLDPGIDHMSAKRIIDRIQRDGGRIISFKSYCGGLPAPDANDNPWGYKFSWSPRGVLRACNAPARFRQDGTIVDIAATTLFDCAERINVPGVGELEAYPNRDSLPYVDLLGLGPVETILRATLRYPGWCDTLRHIIRLGLLDDSQRDWPAGTTLANFTQSFLPRSPEADVRTALAKHLGLAPDADPLNRFAWLGLFGDTPLPASPASPLDVMTDQMLAKMTYAPGERDMIVMLHTFVAEHSDGRREQIAASLVEFGQPNGDSAMSRTVGFPAALGAMLIADGKFDQSGVHIPVLPEIYEPVLDRLGTLGIAMSERVTPLAPAS